MASFLVQLASITACIHFIDATLLNVEIKSVILKFHGISCALQQLDVHQTCWCRMHLAVTFSAVLGIYLNRYIHTCRYLHRSTHYVMYTHTHYISYSFIILYASFMWNTKIFYIFNFMQRKHKHTYVCSFYNMGRYNNLSFIFII